MDYKIYLFANQTENADVFLIKYKLPVVHKWYQDPRPKKIEDFDVVNLSELQEANGGSEYPIYLSWHDYLHPDVYILARKKDSTIKAFKFELQFQYQLNLPLSVGVKIVIGFFSAIAFIGIIIGLLYLLHIKDFIEVRIPRWGRKGCFKNYISPEEKAAIQAEIEKKK